jgi:hypothetical protein
MASAAMAQQNPPAKEGAGNEPAPTAAEIDAAVKTLGEFTADQKKVAGYCAITKEMSGLKEGEDKKAEELGKKMDDYLNSQGENVVDAFSMAEAVDPASEGGKKLDTAFSALEAKCGS